jgi:hypothetical protein
MSNAVWLPGRVFHCLLVSSMGPDRIEAASKGPTYAAEGRMAFQFVENLLHRLAWGDVFLSRGLSVPLDARQRRLGARQGRRLLGGGTVF